MEGRGDELRAMLGVDEVSPQSSRKFRNHFEHFDERLEAWAAEDHAFLYDCNVGPMGMFGNVDTAISFATLTPILPLSCLAKNDTNWPQHCKQFLDSE